jgi:glycosyltransferase involved in cell wall biosynthesis
VLYLNHADHIFWLGVGISDLVVNLRRSGHLLSIERRGVPPERNAFMPIALGDRQRTLSRVEAKRQLGYSEDIVLLLTIARPVKFEYRSDSGDSYIDAVLPVVQQFEQVRLVLVGPSPRGEFQRAHDATEGRITALGERTDNEVLYQAADIYIDSFPQPSPTSLLEAGSYGVPVIGLCPHPESAAILCADAPGIDDAMIRARSVPELRDGLERLISDHSTAMELGARTKSDIERRHIGRGWKRELEQLYVQATTTPPLLDVPSIGDTAHLGSPDATIALASPPIVDIDDLLPHHMRLLPLRPRVSYWLRAQRSHRRLSPALLLSEPAASQIKRAQARMRRPGR